MRKLFYLSGILLLSLSSCKKSNEVNPLGTITADIDGSNVTFNTMAMAIKANAGGVYSLVINGYQGAAGSSNQITVTVGGSEPVVVGTYTNVITGPVANSVSFAYTQQPGNTLYAATGAAPYTATVTYTSITSTSVEGTFSGGVTLAGSSGTPTSHTITNGKFNVKIQN